MDTSLQCLLFIAVLILFAKAMAHMGSRISLPLVLGELAAGVVLGPTVLNIWRFSWFSSPNPNAASLPAVFQVLAQLGVVALMFLAGLETDIRLLRASVAPAFWAATGGVLLPMAGGALVSRIAGFGWPEAIFIGTVLTATSVTITAQTLLDLGKMRSRAGATILGAAVIDDVLGLIVLSIVIAMSAHPAQASSGLAGAAFPIARMTLFLVIAFALGPRLVRFVLNRTEPSSGNHSTASAALALAFLFAFAAAYLGGMAAITGAYLAGVFAAATPARKTIVGPLRSLCNAFFGPVFFVSIGLQIDARDLGGHLGFFLALLLVAVAGKIVGCAAGAFATGFGARNSIVVGVGMIPRGEVGLITASIGFAAGLISRGVYVQVIVLVLATTLITPALLRFAFARHEAVAEPVLAPLTVESAAGKEFVSPV
ncbi:MAG: cation:proton antiporter [Acidobacteriia bacterium]|nr:cation:proton antiporter [Terriglobia bacterium]